MKIAVCASEDEKYTEHFGQAQKFLIYEFDGENVEFLEKRESLKIAGEKHQWEKSLEVVEDCEVIIAEQIGMRAKSGLKKHGKKALEDDGIVEEVLERFVAHEKFMNKPVF
jgi:predicted Fe-Mo cluster-binding NifX family protein